MRLGAGAHRGVTAASRAFNARAELAAVPERSAWRHDFPVVMNSPAASLETS